MACSLAVQNVDFLPMSDRGPMRSSTRKRLMVVIAALAAVVLAVLIFCQGYSTGMKISLSRQQDAEVTRQDGASPRQDSASARETTNTIGEASVAASTAPISQGPCD